MGGLFLLIILVIIGAIVSSSRRAAKAAKKAAEERKKHVQAVWLAVSNLVTASDALLGGNSKEDSELYKLWILYYGDRQPKLLQVSSLISTAQQVYHKAFEAFERLSQQYSSGIETISDADLKLLELLYLSLRGKNALSTEQINALLDPVQVPDEVTPEQTDSKLLSQINQVLKGLSSDSIYNTPVNNESSKSTDAEGVLGYIAQVKGYIAELAIAVNGISKLQQQLAKQKEAFLDDFMPLGSIDRAAMEQYIAKAVVKIAGYQAAHLYLQAEDWLQGLNRLVAPHFWNDTIAKANSHIQQAESIASSGIRFGDAEDRLATVKTSTQEVAKIVDEVGFQC